MGWCAVLPRLSCARLGRCHPACLRCPGLGVWGPAGAVCARGCSRWRGPCARGALRRGGARCCYQPQPCNPNPNPNPDPNPTYVGYSRRLLTSATYCGYLRRCVRYSIGFWEVPYLSLTSSWCLIMHQLAPVLWLLYLRTAVHMGRSREAAVSLVSATLNCVGTTSLQML